MKLLVFICLPFFVLACGQNVKVDISKLNTLYFIGEYKTDYNNETEKITLKGNGYYDYIYGKNNDTIIKNAGEWHFQNYSETHLSIELKNFPLIRKNKVYEDTSKRINVSFDVDLSITYLGDLYDKVGVDENYYTFEKLNKNKNKDYIINK